MPLKLQFLWSPGARAELRKIERETAMRILLALTRYGATGEGDVKEEARAEGGKLSKVAATAKERYNRLANAEPMEVSASFAPRIENITFNRLVNGLVGSVANSRATQGAA